MANSETRFMTKKDFLIAFAKGRYDFIEPNAQSVLNICKDNDVLLMEVSTGSGLKVHKAEKVDETKFLELMTVSAD